MRTLPLRLLPGDDLRRAIDATLVREGAQAGFVLSGIGSLGRCSLRLAGATQVLTLEGPLEILGLAGTLAVEGSHLHMSIADAEGRVLGGHVGIGCIVRTTAEILLALLPEWRFERRPDATTGYAELAMARITTSTPAPDRQDAQ